MWRQLTLKNAHETPATYRHKIKIICTEALLSIEDSQHSTTMYIVKRDGRQQSCQFDKIQSRISKLCYGLDQKVRAYCSDDGACEIICHDMMYSY